MVSTNAANGAKKPRGKPFTGKDDPRRNKRGQRNAAAVAFTRTLRELIVKEGERSLSVQGEKHKKVEWMVRQLWSKAIAGEAWAVNIIMDRTEGKITEHSEITGANGGPIETKNVSELTDDERIARLAAIFERARARRSGQSVGGADKT